MSCSWQLQAYSILAVGSPRRRILSPVFISFSASDRSCIPSRRQSLYSRGRPCNTCGLAHAVHSKTVCTECRGETAPEGKVRFCYRRQRVEIVGKQSKQLSLLPTEAQTYLEKSCKLLPCLAPVLECPRGMSEVHCMAPVWQSALCCLPLPHSRMPGNIGVPG